MSDRTADRRSRRAFLTAAGTAGLAALAGCGGQPGTATTPSGGVGATTTEADPGGQTTTEADDLLPAPTLGATDADVTVMAFEDYACPHCRDYSLDVFPEIRSRFVDPGRVRYEFHDLPIPVSDASHTAASAARAVQDAVGDDAYFEFSHAQFENQGDLGPSLYADLAGEAGADPDTVRSAAVERRYRATVRADRQRGVEMGISGTPGIVVDGTVLEGYGVDRIAGAIEDAL